MLYFMVKYLIKKKMPGGKSKRNKQISLPQVKKKGFSLKTKVINRTWTYIK